MIPGWVLIMVFFGSYQAAAEVSQTPFDTKSLCEAARTAIETDIGNKSDMRAYCVKTKNGAPEK